MSQVKLCVNPDCQKEWIEHVSLCPACGWTTVPAATKEKVKKDKWTQASISSPLEK